MKKRTFIFMLLFMGITLSITAQNTEKFVWPEHEITPIFKEFVKAYNSNDIKTLEKFTKKHYEKDFEKAATYWPSVFADFGEVEPFKTATSWTNNNRLAMWLQGKQTKGWVMIMLRINTATNKIIGKSVMRGERPSGKLPPYTLFQQKI